MPADTPSRLRVPQCNVEYLTARVEKMNRRAAKLGLEPITLTTTGHEEELRFKRSDDFEPGGWSTLELKPGESVDGCRSRHMDAHPGRYRYSVMRFDLITVAGSLPRVNGWAMRATIQHDEEGNLLHVVPGYETPLPLKYRTATTACEHCGHNRIRKDTYVLEHEDGSWKQVGRNCLADFIRSTNAAQWAEAATFLASSFGEFGDYEDEDYLTGTGRGERLFHPSDLLARVACIVRQDGWCSRTEAKNSMVPKQATVDNALDFFDDKMLAKMKASTIEKYTPNAKDYAEAAAAIDWAQELPLDVNNDYLWNIRTVAHRDDIRVRESGLAASIIVAYQRHLEREVKRAYEKATTLDEHFGEIGKRATYTLTVMGLREIEGGYGLTTLYRFRDPDGRIAVWFASGEGGSLDIGSTYTVDASIKKHDVYNGTRQTTLTRLKVRLNHTAFEDCLRGDHKEACWASPSGQPCEVCGEVLNAVAA